MQVMMLAAGKSTRLGALGEAVPKPLVPVCGFPPLAFGLSLVRAAGLSAVVVNLHHHGEAIRSAVGDGSEFGVRVQFSDEPEILGTGGGLVKARPLFRSEPVLVMNGKVVLNLDLRAVMAEHVRSKRLATMVLRADPREEAFAPVLVDESGRVVGLRGRRGPQTVAGEMRRLMFTGIHIVESALLDRLPPSGMSDVVGDAYLPALEAGGAIGSFVTTGYFAEHSTPPWYLEGNLALLRDPAQLAVVPGALTGVDAAAFVDPGATVKGPVRIAAGAVVEAGAVVGPETVVDRGARVVAGCRISQSVVWPGAVARGELSRVVVTAAGVIPVGISPP